MPSREPVPSVSTERTTVAQEDGKAPPTTAKFLARSSAKFIGRHIILNEPLATRLQNLPFLANPGLDNWTEHSASSRDGYPDGYGVCCYGS